MIARAESTRRDAPVARAISRSGAQHRGAIGVVKRDRRTRFDTTTRQCRRGHAGVVVGTAAAGVGRAGQIGGTGRRRCRSINRHRQARRCSTCVACGIGHFSLERVRTVIQRAGCDAPVARTIGCCCAEQRRAIGVIQLDGGTRFSAAPCHGRRGHAGDVVGTAAARIRARRHVQARWRCRCRGVQGVGLPAGESTSDGLGGCVDDARATVVQVQPQRAIARQGVDGNRVSGTAARNAGNGSSSRACGRQHKVADIHASDRLVVGDRVVHAAGIGQGRCARTVDAGHRWT